MNGDNYNKYKCLITNFQFLIKTNITEINKYKCLITNFQFLIKKEMLNNQQNRIYDLEERTAKFGEEIIEFAKKNPHNIITIPLVSQLVKAGTSVGSNYCEADCAESRRDFEHKIGICKKEAKESKHWLRMITKAVPELTDEARKLWKEAVELQLIFIAIIKKSRFNKMENEIKNHLVIRN